MAYIILINDSNELYGSKKERIMQRSTGVDVLTFITDPIYKNTYDMTGATVMLEYVLPCSKRYLTEILELSEEKYNDCYLQYHLPFTTKLTSEPGEIELQLTFAWTELDVNGNGIQHVRKTSPTTIKVIPISAWADIIPDEALSGLDQRIIAMSSQMQAIDEYMNVLDNNKADNIVYDKNEDALQLTSNGKTIGDKVSVKEMLKDGMPVVNLDSSSGSDDTSDKNNNKCNCGCNDEDDVVEIGYDPIESDNKDTIEDDDIVHF